MTGLPIKYRWQWQLGCRPEELWPLIADEFKLCHALGLNTPGEADAKSKSSASGKQASALERTLSNSLHLACAPDFTWVQNHELNAYLKFYSKLIHAIKMTIRVEENNHGCAVHHHVSVYPTSLIGKLSTPLLIGKAMREHLQSSYETIEEYLASEAGPAYAENISQISPAAQLHVDEAAEHLADLGFRESWIRHLIACIAYEPDARAKSIEPYAFANQHSLPVDRAIDLLLSAVKEQLLSFQWRLRCPRCADVRYLREHLKLIPPVGHCSRCDIHFSTHLHKNVELAFKPHRHVRRIEAKKADSVDPLTRTQEYMRVVIEPAGQKSIELDLPPGKYRIRSSNTGPSQWYHLDVTSTKQAQVHVLVFDERLEVNSAIHYGKHKLKVQNSSAVKQLVIFESINARSRMLLANRVLTNQHFHALFPGETVSEESPAPIGPLALLVADVAGSTLLYECMGDEASYRLIREFYQFVEKNIRACEGAIIKGVGDYIMAAFVNPVRAVKAGLRIRENLDTFNATLGTSDQLRVRLALHYGPCMAINMSQTIDFFGHSVNTASALQHLSDEEDLILSEEAWAIPELRHFLEGNQLKVDPINSAEPQKAYRLRHNPSASQQTRDELEVAPVPAPQGSDAGHRDDGVDLERQNRGES